MTDVAITTPYIKLDSFLKLAGLCSTGGQAKIFIMEGKILVNGESCLMRGKKLHSGDKIQMQGEKECYCVTAT